MFCTIMFSILESLVYGVSEWCSTRLSTPAKCWIWVIAISLSYMIILLIVKTCLKVFKPFQNANFKELYKAAEKNDIITIISILTRNPAYVNKFKYPEGYTPFMVACANANTQMVKFMLKMGANVKQKSKSNETPFYLAAFYYIQNKNYKNATCIRELYYAGADINEPGKNNVTPLQMAAIFGHTSLIKWLLLKNASMKTCPHPYLLAKSQGHHEAANFIELSMQHTSIDFKSSVG